jgi:hypothetical protein
MNDVFIRMPLMTRAGWSTKADVDTADKLRDLLTQANVSLNKVINRIEVAASPIGHDATESDTIIKNGVEIPIEPTLLQAPYLDQPLELKNTGITVTSMRLAVQLQQKLKTYVQCNIEFIKAVKNNDIKTGQRIFFYSSYSKSVGPHTIVCATVIDGIRCELCNVPCELEELKWHQRTWGCGVNQGKLMAETQGMETIKNHEDALAVRKALKVKSLLIPTRFEVVAPQWVHQAIDTYHSNGDYAGMDLAEFINRMAPDERPQEDVQSGEGSQAQEGV